MSEYTHAYISRKVNSDKEGYRRANGRQKDSGKQTPGGVLAYR